MKFIKPLALVFLLPATFYGVEAKMPTSLRAEARAILSQDSLALNQKLPFDNEVVTGKLKNGFTYFIRKNTEPKGRVTMYLGMKAGSILENEKQLGLAHFLEHMNFNGLKHFPKNELVNYLQKAGVRFGSDLNAYTSFDQTVYQLPIPSDDPELLKNGLQVMRDWAQDALLDGEEIDKERGVILEEKRGGRGVQQRLQDQYFPMVLNGSLYSKRLPIGTEEILKTFPYSEIRKFHQDWYRPDLQALIIVGDIDPKAIEEKVKALFSDMTMPKKVLPRKEFRVDLLNKNQFLTISDPELPYTVAQILIKNEKEKVVTVGDYRNELLKSIFNQMIAGRFSELMQQPNPPFMQAGGSIGDFVANLNTFSLVVVPKPGELESGFKAMLTEFERIQKYGFTQTELDRALADMKKGNEMAYIERDKKKSDSYVNRYLNYFIDHEPALSNEASYNLTKQLLPTLKLEEVNALVKKYYTDLNRDILIMGPEKEKANLPTEQAVLGWVKAVEDTPVSAYEDKVSNLPLLSKEPVKGTILSSKDIGAVQAKELQLSNGVKVILKPTDFKNDEIQIVAYSPGGTSLYPDADYFSASNASSLVDASGVGQMSNVELTKYLAGKEVSISPYISERYEGISGRTDKEGLKNAFELIYGYFTEPRLDSDIFQSTMTRAKGSLENRLSDPNNVFSDKVKEVLYGNNVRRQNPTVETLTKIDPNRALAIYKERFADASDFVFTIVGSFDENQIKPYIETYLASLPAVKRGENYKDLNILEPAKGERVVVHKGKEQKASTQLAYYGDYDYSEAENVNMEALESVLTIKLLERLREKEGGVYGVGARAGFNKLPKARYAFSIGFGSAVDKADALIASALDEVKKIQDQGPEKVDIEKFVAEQRRQNELNLRENGYWLNYISSSYQNDLDISRYTRRTENLNKVTPKSVQDVAGKYLKKDRLFEFILMPDSK
ncbi:insulinase family protein [Sphingobacterium puteale]|uniref:Insulinase family protein n=1 Tax=Sphingobacterium puteale TaxID=2420510 RepID=A0A420VZ99_9SPHI|nr:M16 family metallopeptidase [Sphingobacterium puteale]RKO71664.1 insulinase family protein [Sphingobacterium puteale]